MDASQPWTRTSTATITRDPRERACSYCERFTCWSHSNGVCPPPSIPSPQITRKRHSIGYLRAKLRPTSKNSSQVPHIYIFLFTPPPPCALIPFLFFRGHVTRDTHTRRFPDVGNSEVVTSARFRCRYLGKYKSFHVQSFHFEYK